MLYRNANVRKFYLAIFSPQLNYFCSNQGVRNKKELLFSFYFRRVISTSSSPFILNGVPAQVFPPLSDYVLNYFLLGKFHGSFFYNQYISNCRHNILCISSATSNQGSAKLINVSINIF